MAERYTRLYEFPGGLYAAGAPVLIRAGVLLRDNRSQNVLVQLKLCSLDSRPIRAVQVAIGMFDAQGQSMGPELLRSYSRLKAERDEEFGQRSAQVLPYREVRAITARVTEVVFSDGTLWTDEGQPWEHVPNPILLAEAYESEEMAAQFRIRYGTDCLYAPMDCGELWTCTCGAMNFRGDKSCHRCHRALRALLNVNEDSLFQECADRLQNEEETQEEETPAGGGGRRFLYVLAWLGSLLLILGIIFYTPRLLDRIVPLPRFDDAAPTARLLAAESEETAEPTAEPTPASTPKPTPKPEPTPVPTLSPEQQKKADYEAAVSLLDAGGYSAARAILLRLGDYKNSAELANEAIYRKAAALYDFIDQYDERDVYALLSMESGSTNRFSLSTEKALELGSDVVDKLQAACGSDLVDLNMSEKRSEGLKPLAACVKELFSLLGDYKDCPERLASLEKMTDYTRDFYMLCQAGNIYGAYDWLQDYKGDFKGREHWLQLLELYKPFCDEWVLLAGDYTLLPLTVGHQFPCMGFHSRVMIDGDKATLRLTVREGESEFNVDLYTETGTTNFSYSDDGPVYAAAINYVDHLAYMKFGETDMLSSCEYRRAD